MKQTRIVISCEHAENKVPEHYAILFAENKEELNTHRSYDIGALAIARTLSQAFDASFSQSRISRLLIDCNRSLSNPRCFSEFTRSLPKKEKQKLIDTYYLPYRQETESNILKHIEKGEQVLHLSIHSFTPELSGKKRNAAIGLLYDPKRHGETEVVRLLQSLLVNQTPHYKVRKNYPYRGDTDGLTTAFRKKYSENSYLGIEVECNQILLSNKHSHDLITEALLESLKELLQLL